MVRVQTDAISDAIPRLCRSQAGTVGDAPTMTAHPASINS
jgi:hypothetical protein